MIIVGRHIDGITINPLEYLLETNGDEIQFETEEQAREYLTAQGVTDEEMYWFVFQQVNNVTGYLKFEFFEDGRIEFSHSDLEVAKLIHAMELYKKILLEGSVTKIKIHKKGEVANERD